MRNYDLYLRPAGAVQYISTINHLAATHSITLEKAHKDNILNIFAVGTCQIKSQVMQVWEDAK